MFAAGKKAPQSTADLRKELKGFDFVCVKHVRAKKSISILWIIDKKAYICAQKINIMIPIDKLGTSFRYLKPYAALAVLAIFVYLSVNKFIEFLHEVKDFTEAGAERIGAGIFVFALSIFYFVFLAIVKDRKSQILGGAFSLILISIGLLLIYYSPESTQLEPNKEFSIHVRANLRDGRKVIAGASVYVDNYFLGKTDKEGRFVTQDPRLNYKKTQHNVRLELEGYNTYTTTVGSGAEITWKQPN